MVFVEVGCCILYVYFSYYFGKFDFVKFLSGIILIFDKFGKDNELFNGCYLFLVLLL